jgi:LysR family transcriptional regulator, low CO2-responsive transcriptional regulator
LRHTLARDAASGKLAILDVVHFPIKRHWYVARPKGKQLSIVAQSFLDYLCGACATVKEG